MLSDVCIISCTGIHLDHNIRKSLVIGPKAFRITFVCQDYYPIADSLLDAPSWNPYPPQSAISHELHINSQLYMFLNTITSDIVFLSLISFIVVSEVEIHTQILCYTQSVIVGWAQVNIRLHRSLQSEGLHREDTFCCWNYLIQEWRWSLQSQWH